MEDEEEDDNLSALALRGTPPPPWGGTSSDPAIAPALQHNLRTALLPPTPSKADPVCLLLKQY